jgi:hypothetical protein
MSGAWRRGSWGRMAVVFTGLAALGAYLVPRLLAGRAQWPMWDVDVWPAVR